MSAVPAESGEAPPRKPRPIRRDWVSKTLAGLLLGLTLAMIAAGMLMTLLRGMPLPMSGQFAMWLVPPVWLGVLSFVYFFSSGLRAWASLLGANALALGLWWLLWKGGAA